MKNFKKIALTHSIVLILVALLSCNKDENLKKVEVDPKVCYKGVLIVRDCPSFAVINVLNANIGDKCEFMGVTYQNAITINNFPHTISNIDTVYFSIEIPKAKEDCIIHRPCPTIITIDKSVFPKTRYCASFISSTSCDKPKVEITE